MAKRIETDIPPFGNLYFKLCRKIAADPNADPDSQTLALLAEEVGLVLNELLARFEYGEITISDSPPNEGIQFAPRERRRPS